MRSEAPEREQRDRVRTFRRRTLPALALLIIAAQPYLFWNTFAGDAQVHLVFMESAARGRFFEFNPGETVSGETSPGYMMLGAGLFRLLPAASVPVALKILGLLSWYALCWLVWRVAIAIVDNGSDDTRPWAHLAAIVAATIAGSVYNASAGMENGLFAAVVWGWMALASKWRWFERGEIPIRRDLILSSILGAACWLRPEGFVIVVVSSAVRARRARPRVRDILTGLLVPCGIGVLGFAFESAFTGDLVPTSLLSRRVLAMPHTFALGPITLDPAFAKRLVAYLPLTALYLVGLRPSPTGAPRSSVTLFLDTLLGVFFVLYTLAGAPHLARYLMFLMPVLAIGAARGAMRLWRFDKPVPRWLVAIAAALTVVVNVVEHARRRDLYTSGQLAAAIAAPAHRRERTDDLLGLLGEPAKRPVVVALESVQLRYALDDRIVVRSLDGRADRRLLGFVGRGTVDHIGYLRAQGVVFLLDTPNYNRAAEEWSLAKLNELHPNDATDRSGLRFQRVSSARFWSVRDEQARPAAP